MYVHCPFVFSNFLLVRHNLGFTRLTLNKKDKQMLTKKPKSRCNDIHYRPLIEYKPFPSLWKPPPPKWRRMRFDWEEGQILPAKRDKKIIPQEEFCFRPLPPNKFYAKFII